MWGRFAYAEKIQAYLDGMDLKLLANRKSYKGLVRKLTVAS